MSKDIRILQNISGIGEKMSEKIMLSLGSEENLQKVIEEENIDELTKIDGISSKKAADIIKEMKNKSPKNFIKSERAMEIYEEILSKITVYSNTSYAKNKILLLSPSKNEREISRQLEFSMNAKEEISKLPIAKLRTLMRNLNEIENPKPVYDASKVVLVEKEEDNAYLTDLGVNQYYPIMTADEMTLMSEELLSYDLIFYIYSEGILDIEGIPNMVMISINEQDYEMIPEKTINFFKTNEDLFKKVYRIQEIRGNETALGEIFPILEEINNINESEVDIEKLVESLKKDIDIELEKAIKHVDLEGDEILNLLNNNFPPKIEKIFDDIISKRKTIIKEKCGFDFDPFIKKYPIEIDEEEIQRISLEQTSQKENKIFDTKKSAAIQLNALKEKAIKEVEETIKFDYEFAIGSFAYEYELTKPQFTENIILEGALHLELQNKKEVQKINYQLTEDENIALLTGANSGGKTTLLETLTQISIMAQMGLPVRADYAEVKLLDEIYHFSKKRSMDAGAFESFLNVFIPIVTTKSEKLVLLDELEGITELDAAVKIISTFIDMIKETKSYGVIVTHMARELMTYTDIRVDGIEAKGLDENYNLIVDRTPKMHFLANSTPELILKRIYEKSDDNLKEVYKRILEKF